MIDMAKDQQFILDRAMDSLAADGALIFSTMFPSLHLDSLVKNSYQCTDLSRNMSGALLQKRRQHFQCWQIEHR